MKIFITVMLLTLSSVTLSLEWTESVMEKAIEGCIDGALEKSLPINIQKYEESMGEKLDTESDYYKKIVTAIKAHYKPYCKCVSEYTRSKFKFEEYQSMSESQLSKFGKEAWKNCL